ncbi:hypothetical protein IJ076_00610 [Candidatus Saccharibacteria bacterium]|nr:hypothetical protein [Candidatus Saccharibacteria bacterium]
MSKDSKVSFKVWLLFGIAVAVIVAVIVVLTTVAILNRNKNEMGETTEITEPVIMEYTDVELDEDVNETLTETFKMTPDEAYAYVDKQIQRYTGTNLWARLVMLKAQLYVENEQYDLALETALKVNEDDVEDDFKFSYYNMMHKIYYLKKDDAKVQEYDDKYWAFYNQQFGTDGITDEDEIDESFITEPMGLGGENGDE